MNDFTKEELEEIAFNLGEIRTWSDTLENSWPVLDKIQYMIDNYDAKVIEVWHCEKCGHVQ